MSKTTGRNTLKTLNGESLYGPGDFVIPTDVSTGSFVQKSANYTAASTDEFIECTTGTFTVSLMTAVGIAGKKLTIINSGTGVITVDPAGSETINDETTIELLNTDAMSIVSNGTNWKII